MFTFADSNLVVLDVGSHTTKAARGLVDLISQAPVLVYSVEVAIRKPISRGDVIDWEALEALWRHIVFRELSVKKSRNESPVLVTVPVRWPREYLERIIQILFEGLNVPAVYIGEQPVMTVYGVGTGTGLVVDIGATTTDITPVVDGMPQYHAALTLDVAGADLDEYLCLQLAADTQTVSDLGGNLPTVDFARFVKESGVCHVLEDPDAPIPPAPQQSKSSTDGAITTSEKEDGAVKETEEPQSGEVVAKGQAALPADTAAVEQVKMSLQDSETDLSFPTGTPLAVAGVDGEAQKATSCGMIGTDDTRAQQNGELPTSPGETMRCGDAAAQAAPNAPPDGGHRVDVEWNRKKVSIGRARYCVADPLFQPDIVGRTDTLPLPEAIYCSVMSCDVEKRISCFGNIIVTGGHAALKGIHKRLARELRRFATGTDVSVDAQLRDPRFGRLPDYFAALRDRDQFATFLGAEICAKHVFADPKFYISKVDYNEHGPVCAWIGKDEHRMR